MVPAPYTTSARSKGDRLLFFTNKFVLQPPKDLFKKGVYKPFLGE